MRLFRPCILSGYLYPGSLFRIRTAEKILCLTFDDGPDPDSTPCLLEILRKHEVKAIFFCTGNAAEKYPDIVSLIKKDGHMVGNHGYNHLNGWTTSVKRYVADSDNASGFTSSTIFRPPYGRLRLSQFKRLKSRYKIVFWDLMPYDFDKSFSHGDSLNILIKKVRPGSVIVLHDDPGSSVMKLLPQFIETSKDMGYRFILPDLK